MKKGFLILKPDIFDSTANIKYFFDLLNNNFNNNYIIYRIPNFGNFSQEYRKYDIENTPIPEAEKYIELKRTSYATFAYKHFYNNASAYAVVVNTNNDDDDLYKKLSAIKTLTRSEVKKNKKFDIYIDISTDNWKIYKHDKNNLSDEDYINGPNIKIAYTNGIHLEEEYLFNNQIGLKFLIDNTIINERNIVNISEFIKE